MEAVQYIDAVFEDLKKEVPKAVSGNKASCRRSRKHCMVMIKQLKEYRKLLLERCRPS